LSDVITHPTKNPSQQCRRDCDKVNKYFLLTKNLKIEKLSYSPTKV